MRCAPDHQRIPDIDGGVDRLPYVYTQHPRSLQIQGHLRTFGTPRNLYGTMGTDPNVLIPQPLIDNEMGVEDTWPGVDVEQNVIQDVQWTALDQIRLHLLDDPTQPYIQPGGNTVNQYRLRSRIISGRR